MRYMIWSVTVLFRHDFKMFDPFLNLLKNAPNVLAFVLIFLWLYLQYQSLQAFFNTLYFSGSIGTSKNVSKVSLDFTELPSISCARAAFLKISLGIKFSFANVRGLNVNLKFLLLKIGASMKLLFILICFSLSLSSDFVSSRIIIVF